MVKKKKYVPPKDSLKRTTVWLHDEEAIQNYLTLSEEVGVKQHVVDTIGRMIINGEFDYKAKEKNKKVRADGNYQLFKEVKQKVKELGYSNMTEIFNEILKDNENDIREVLNNKNESPN
ncbi:hypothetical protein AALK46_12710 [Staphylococcus nepalensis]|uniref:hypothetical protein n=1 Tax=Staphylococcus TaxID=1279 RepID=UPI002DBB675A|nr:hypothetical protein [Staphylococcus pseudoxylosus]MEB6038203.1 hypothetical protein [Staphylococcus pseudoxylosus]